MLEEKGAEPVLVQANVRNKADCQRLAATFPSVDILVNNAAIGVLKAAEKIRINQWDLTMESSLRPMWYLTTLCPLADGADVIGISSMGSQRFIPGYAAMGAAKGGLEALTRQLAVELSPRRIRVNTVCGGLTETDALRYLFNGDEMAGFARAHTPLRSARPETGGLGQPEDIADAVWLLTRPEASWITGQVLVVDGGLSLL